MLALWEQERPCVGRRGMKWSCVGHSCKRQYPVNLWLRMRLPGTGTFQRQCERLWLWASPPFPCEGDFLRERDIEKAPCMKRPAASRKETTACRRGLKRPAAAGHVEKASGSQALDPEGKDLSKPGGKSRKDLLAGSPSLAASSHPNLERKR